MTSFRQASPARETPSGRAAFTVIVPARHAAHTLPACLRAIADSTRLPAEVIVVVDGATPDGTSEAARATGVRVLELPERLGPGGARNAGVALATTPIVVFVDADVAVDADAFEILAGALDSNEDVAAAFGSYDTEPPWENLASQYKNLLHHFVHQQAREEAETFWAGLGAVRREAFLGVSGFDAERYTRPSIEDIELGHRLKEKGHRLWLVKSAQGSHLKRWDPGSVFRTDLLHRALPWTQLILRAGRMPDDLNLGLRHRVGVLCVAGLLVSLAAVPADPRLWVLVAVFLIGAGAAASDVLAFFARERGVLFAGLAFPLHLLYYLASGAGFVLGLVRHTAPAPPRALAETRRILANALSLGAGEIAARLFSFLATIHLARVLGASGFGRLELATSVVLYASAAATFGLDWVGMLRVAVDGGHARVLTRAVVSLRLLLASVATFVLLGLTLVVPRLTEMRTLLLLSALAVFAEALSVAWVFRGLERMKRVAAVGILGQALYAAGAFLFVRGPEDLHRAALVTAAGPAFASAVLGAVAIWVFRRLPRDAPPGMWRSLLREASPIALLSLAGMVTYNADVILLGFWSDDRHVGLYRAASRIAGIFQMLGAAFSAAVFPLQAREAGDPDRFEKALDWSVNLSILGWAAATSTAFVAAPFLLRLTFGTAYGESVLVLRLLLLAAAVVGVRAQYRGALMALRKTERSLPAVVLTALMNVSLNLLLLPRLGLRGMAYAAILSETLLLVLLRREVNASLPRRSS